MDILELFGKKVRQYRNARGMSQEELAEESDLHRNFISKVERGEKNISLMNMAKIANALRIDLSDLLKL
jgi:transcriptional regulator with XRE-family HTH domain